MLTHREQQARKKHVKNAEFSGGADLLSASQKGNSSGGTPEGHGPDIRPAADPRHENGRITGSLMPL